jgi:hypothetical protein
MKTVSKTVATLLFLATCANLGAAKEKDWDRRKIKIATTMEQEKASVFSYQANSTYQIGFKDSPEATTTTDGGLVSTHFFAFHFLGGNELTLIQNRINTLERGFLPILSVEQKFGNVVYQAEMFSAPEDLDPVKNLISYIQWEIKNTGTTTQTAKFGLAVEPFSKDYHVYGGKNPPVGDPYASIPYPSNEVRRLNGKTRGDSFHRHNSYCTGWWRDQFMDFNVYKESGNTMSVENNSLVVDGFYVLEYPEAAFAAHEYTFKNKTLAGRKYEWELAPGETQTLLFKLPFVPIGKENVEQIAHIKKADYHATKKSVVDFWDKVLSQAATFQIPEKKVNETYTASLVNLLVARDVLEDGKSYEQKCNEMQYDWTYIRDGAYFCRVYDFSGLKKECREILQPYFIFDEHGTLLGFNKRTGIFQKLCFDYWGQVLWAAGSYYRQNRDPEVLELVYQILPQHIEEFRQETAKDPDGLWPATWPYDNEHIHGHYTGHSFWALLGMRHAILMAKDMGRDDHVAEWTQLYNEYKATMDKALERITKESGGYIPPGLDDPLAGYDWANASAGLYPFEAVAVDKPYVRKTLDQIRKYNYMEGVTTYSGGNALAVSKSVLSGKVFPKRRGLHQYEIFYVTQSLLALGEQQKVIEDLYSFLVHANSTNAGFEWGPTPWGSRTSGGNRAPHGWCGARYMELVRNMLLREVGNDVYLMSALSPEWAKPGKTIKVANAPTYGGTFSYTADFAEKKMTLQLEIKANKYLEKVYLVTPWFLQGLKIEVDGRPVTTAEKIEIPVVTKQVTYAWDRINAPELSFNKAVDIFLKKYHAPQKTDCLSHLFPTLLAPQVMANANKDSVTLYSPDNYAPVYYTTDGSTPTSQSKKYTAPISKQGIKTIKAICIDANGEVSDTLVLDID